MAIFDYKTGDFLRFLAQTCPPTEVTAKYFTGTLLKVLQTKSLSPRGFAGVAMLSF